MRTIPLIFPFCLSLCALFLGGIFLPTLKLLTFAPFLALVFRKKSFLSSLWIAASCGLLIDLLNTDIRFGLFALAYVSTAAILYRLHPLFFEEKPLSLFLYISLISSVLSISQYVLMNAFSKSIPLTFPFALTSFLLMPIVDGVVAFLWLIGPLMLYSKLKT